MQQVLNMEERIQAYIDKECNEEERLFIEQKINNDESWSRLYRSMQAMHELLSIGLETMEPSMRFSKNVMEEVAGLQIAKPTRQYLNPMVHWLVGWGCFGFDADSYYRLCYQPCRLVGNRQRHKP